MHWENFFWMGLRSGKSSVPTSERKVGKNTHQKGRRDEEGSGIADKRSHRTKLSPSRKFVMAPNFRDPVLPDLVEQGFVADL
jgi:hypothetical protein